MHCHESHCHRVAVKFECLHDCICQASASTPSASPHPPPLPFVIPFRLRTRDGRIILHSAFPQLNCASGSPEGFTHPLTLTHSQRDKFCKSKLGPRNWSARSFGGASDWKTPVCLTVRGVVHTCFISIHSEIPAFKVLKR